MIDLLSPVGDFDCLKSAVQNGANSVYFGADLFSARAYASNFNLQELEEAILYAKTRGVKTNLTLNTLVTDNEFDEEYFEFGLFMSRREYKTIRRRSCRNIQFESRKLFIDAFIVNSLLIQVLKA